MGSDGLQAESLGNGDKEVEAMPQCSITSAWCFHQAVDQSLPCPVLAVYIGILHSSLVPHLPLSLPFSLIILWFMSECAVFLLEHKILNGRPCLLTSASCRMLCTEDGEYRLPLLNHHDASAIILSLPFPPHLFFPLLRRVTLCGPCRPWAPRLKKSSCLNLSRSWDYRYATLLLAWGYYSHSTNRELKL